MVFWTCFRLSIYQDFECIRNLNMLEFHRVYWQGSSYTSDLNKPEFRIYQNSEYARARQSSEYAWISLNNFWLILAGKKHPKIKLQRLRKILILTFGSLVHQINSFQEVLELEQIFQKKVVTGKTPLIEIGPFCSCHSICLNIGFWQSSFEWKWCDFNLSCFV